ncbi:MAG TPA: ABC transporter permease [Candidatus Thermoplasmatota archaeon]
MSDVGTVFRKEMWESFGNSRARNQMLVSLLVIVLLADFGLPFLDRDYELSLARVLFFGVMFSVMTPLFSTADTVAGERERHTLETLLSTRLSDRAIVLGKLLAVLTLGLVIAAGMILQGLVAVSFLFGRFDLLPQYLLLMPAVLVGSVILSIALSCIGLLVSMRAQTVQGAAQITSLLAMPVLLLFFVGPAIFGFLVATRGGETVPTDPLSTITILLAVFVVGILIVDVVLVAVTVAAFKRHRLMPK